MHTAQPELTQPELTHTQTLTPDTLHPEPHPEPHPAADAPHFQCRHIFTDGHRCGSHALRRELFCFYHHTTRRPPAPLRPRRSRPSAFTLRPPEDRSAIQHNIGEILTRLAANELDPRRAGLLLYGLQIAGANLPREPRAHAPQPILQVEDIVLDPTHGPLAPATELHAPKPKPTLYDILMDQWNQESTQQPDPPSNPTPTAPNPTPNPLNPTPAELNPTSASNLQPEPTTIPTLQAGEEPIAAIAETRLPRPGCLPATSKSRPNPHPLNTLYKKDTRGCLPSRALLCPRPCPALMLPVPLPIHTPGQTTGSKTAVIMPQPPKRLGASGEPTTPWPHADVKPFPVPTRRVLG